MRQACCAPNWLLAVRCAVQKRSKKAQEYLLTVDSELYDMGQTFIINCLDWKSEWFFEEGEMGRQILGAPAKGLATAPAVNVRIEQGLSGPRLSLRLRQRRSTGFVAQIAKVDSDQHHHGQQELDQLIAAVGAEFPELTIQQRPLGIVAKCCLGHPYEVHVCDLAGGIVEHFELGRPMPQLFERARSLARHNTYSFIEVYADTLRAVSKDGSVSVIER
jgi:hypothetical protein